MLKIQENFCLDYFDGKRARAMNCHSLGGNQAFNYNYRDQIVSSGGECLCEIDDIFIGFCQCGDEENRKWILDEKVLTEIRQLLRQL